MSRKPQRHRESERAAETLRRMLAEVDGTRSRVPVKARREALQLAIDLLTARAVDAEHGELD